MSLIEFQHTYVTWCFTYVDHNKCPVHVRHQLLTYVKLRSEPSSGFCFSSGASHVLEFSFLRTWVPPHVRDIILTYMTSCLLTVASTALLDPRKIWTNILWNEIFFLSCIARVRDLSCFTYVCLWFFKYFKSQFSRFSLVHVSRTYEGSSRTCHSLTYVTLYLTYASFTLDHSSSFCF